MELGIVETYLNLMLKEPETFARLRAALKGTVPEMKVGNPDNLHHAAALMEHSNDQR